MATEMAVATTPSVLARPKRADRFFKIQVRVSIIPILTLP